MDNLQLKEKSVQFFEMIAFVFDSFLCLVVEENSWDCATLPRLNKAGSSDSHSQGLPPHLIWQLEVKLHLLVLFPRVDKKDIWKE